jgi:ligand-binding sensor domain-containing protein
MRMNNLYVFTLLCSITTLYATNSVAQDFNYLIKHITIEEGLSHTDASSILQDKTGFIWVGTLYGLDKFDGYEVKSFYNRTHPKANAYLNRISKIIADNSGARLWIGTEAGLDCFNLRTEAYEEIAVADPEARTSLEKAISGLLLTKDNILFYTNTSGKINVARISAEGKLESYSFPAFDKKNIACLAMAEDKNGNVWFATDSGFYVYDTPGKSVTKVSNLMAGWKLTDIRSLQAGNGNTLLVGMVNGFMVLNLDSLHSTNTPGKLKWVPLGSSNVKTFLSGNVITNVYCIVEQPGSMYWVGTNNGLFLVSGSPGGGYLYQGFQASEWNNKSNITSNRINSLYKDKTGCLWISTSWGGVNMIDLNQKRFMSLRKDPLKNNSLSANFVRSLLEDEKENLWIGTQSNGLNYYDFATGIYKNYVHNPANKSGLSDNSIMSLAKDKQGNLWIGSNNGIDKLSPDGIFEKINIMWFASRLIFMARFGPEPGTMDSAK